LTVSHAAVPWKWPKLYKEEWLQFINEKNVLYTLEPRWRDGVFATQADIIQQVYLHPNRDLAVLHLQDEDEFVKLIEDTLKDEYAIDLMLSDSDQISAEEERRVSNVYYRNYCN
jgi:hypothetical protein